VIGEQNYKGLWWLPGDESDKLSGTLTVTKGEASLELLGHFGHEILHETETERIASGSLAEQPRILGLTSNGKRVTLEGHVSAPYEEHFPGIPIATYTRSVTLIGKHFAEGEGIGFDEIAISASDLNSWTQVFALQGKYGEREGQQPFTKGSVEFEVPDDIEIPLDRGEKASIKFGVQSEGLLFPSEHVSFAQYATLHLRFARRESLQHVFERVGQIRNFLSLAIGRPVAILSVTGLQDDYLREDPKVPMPIELQWGIPHNPEPPKKVRLPHEMFFTLPEASPDISTVMKHWFAKQARLRPAFNLFFGIRYHPDIYLDVRFLVLAQAVETYDYRRRDATDLPAAEHEERVHLILSGAPEQYREWLQTRLQRSNELSLRKRIRDVLNECPAVRDKIVGATSRERDHFISLFVDSRNYYTHYNPELEKRAATGAALFLLTIQLQAIIEMSMLRELGFTGRSIDQIIDRVGRYCQIAHLKAIVAEEAQSGPT
jgi:ApeA N-terminal domain 1